VLRLRALALQLSSISGAGQWRLGDDAAWTWRGDRILQLHGCPGLAAWLEGPLHTTHRCSSSIVGQRNHSYWVTCMVRLTPSSTAALGTLLNSVLPNMPLVPTHNGEAPLLAAQRRR